MLQTEQCGTCAGTCQLRLTAYKVKQLLVVRQRSIRLLCSVLAAELRMPCGLLAAQQCRQVGRDPSLHILALPAPRMSFHHRLIARLSASLFLSLPCP